MTAWLTRCAVPLDRPVGKLSRGQRQQVIVALALGHHPELLVLDDPRPWAWTPWRARPWPRS